VPGSKKEIITDFMINFYRTNGRKYPWRCERTPYKVYLSEVLLQRTRADQVEPVFNHIVSVCPDIRTLYNRFDEVVQRMLSLGRRCRLEYFKTGLEYMLKNYDGKIPADRNLLLAIPGIGNYIAAAIRIFGYGIPDVIIDTNVVRVLCRLYGLQPDGETRRKKYFIELAGTHLPQKSFVEYSYGILDFAAEVCRPHRPGCNMCELNFLCDYHIESKNLKNRKKQIETTRNQ